MKHSGYFLLVAAVLLAAAGPGSLLLAQQLPKLDYQQFTLSNGLTVILVEDHRLPTIDMGLAYNAGSGSEQVGQAGYAHLLEHLMFEGTEHSPQSYLKAMSVFGASAGGGTGKDFTIYSTTLPANYLERALWLESDRMANTMPSVKQERLERQRDVVKNEYREGEENYPYARADHILRISAYPPDHPYSWSVGGKLEDLDKVTMADMQEFHRRYYSPNNAVLLLVGDFKTDTARGLIEKYFSAIPPGPPVEHVRQWIPVPSETRRVTVEDKVNLPVINFQWPTPPKFHADDAAGMVLANCLTGDISARLNKLLIDQRQLALTVEAYQAGMNLAGEFGIQVFVRAGQDLDTVEFLVDSVLNDIAQHGITDAELTTVRNRVATSQLTRLQSRFARLYMAFNFYFMLGSPDRFQWNMDRITHVTSADVQHFVQTYMPIRRATIVRAVPVPTLAASGALPDWSTLPEGSAEPGFTPPAVQTATLANGLHVMLIENPTLPLVQTMVYLPCGRSADPTGKWGLAQTVMALIDEGTTTRTLDQITEETRRLGTAIGTDCDMDGTTLNVNVLKENIDPALRLLADLLENSNFPEKELQKKKGKFIGLAENRKMDPEDQVYSTFIREFYGRESAYGQPVSGLGTSESISAITREDLLDFYHRNYTPDRAVVIMAGAITLAEARDKVNAALGSWKPSTGYVAPAPPVPVARSRRIIVLNQPDATQSYLCIGQGSTAANDANRDAHSIMLSALSSIEFPARLNKVVREDKGYTYGLSVEPHWWRDYGYLCITGQVDTDHTAESVDLILKAIADIAGPVPVAGEELQTIQHQMIRVFPAAFETNADLTGELLKLWRFGLPADDWATHNARIAAVDAAAVKRMAQTQLHPAVMLIVIAGDRTKIEKPLRDLNIGEVSVVELSAP